MKNVKPESVLWVSTVGLLTIWILLVVLMERNLVINWRAIDKLPHAITLWVVVSLVFRNWMWRWKFFHGWLVTRPDLQGTWEGTIQSLWEEPHTGKRIAPIAVILVIRQTLSSLSCIQYSQESESFSNAAEIHIDEDSHIPFLKYNYTNRPRATIRDRSAIHDGAASLRVIDYPNRRLEGEFWTSRCTAGTISLKFLSQKLLEEFPEADPISLSSIPKS